MDAKSSLKVGLAVVLGIAGVVAAWAYLAHLDWNTYAVRVAFADSRGLQPQAPVRMNGVKIGEVRDIELDPASRKPVATLRIEERYRTTIPADSKISITTGLLVTNPQVEIVPGRSTQPLGTDRIYEGQEPSSALAQISPETDQIVKRLAATLDTLTPKLARSMDHVEGILSRTERMVADLTVVSDRARTIAADPDVAKALRSSLRDMEAIARQARKTTDVVGTELSGLAKRNSGRVDTLMTGLFDLLQKFTDTLDSARGLVTRLTDQVTDPRLQQSLQETLELTRATIARFNQVAADVHMLLGDAAVQGDLKATLTSLRDATDSGRKVAADVSKLVERLSLPKGTPSLGIGRPSLSIDFGGRGDRPHFRSNIGFRFPLSDDSGLHLGVFDFAEANKLNVQYETMLTGAGAFRYGLYASKLGVGLDLQTGAGMKLRLDAYDPNRLTVDAKSYVKINDDFSLWVGADSLLRHTTPTLGVRLSR